MEKVDSILFFLLPMAGSGTRKIPELGSYFLLSDDPPGIDDRLASSARIDNTKFDRSFSRPL